MKNKIQKRKLIDLNIRKTRKEEEEKFMIKDLLVILLYMKNMQSILNF